MGRDFTDLADIAGLNGVSRKCTAMTGFMTVILAMEKTAMVAGAVGSSP